MRKAMLFLVVFGLVGSLWAQDPTRSSMGTWKLNLAKSKLPPGDAANIKEAIVVLREMDADTIEGTSTQTTKDGKTTTAKWTTPASGGMQTYQQGGPANGISIVAVIVDPTTVYNVYLQDGRQVFLMRLSFSKDGKTYTGTPIGTNARGNPVEGLWFWEKQ